MKGWVITKDFLNSGDKLDDPFGIPSRVGWGQVVKAVVEAQANSILPPQISVDTDLDPELIEKPVVFKLVDEDDENHYEGVISLDWLEGEDYLAFAPLTFGTADTGATIMDYIDPFTGGWTTL